MNYFYIFLFKTNKWKNKKIVPTIKTTVIIEEFRLILFSNFKGIITQFDINAKKQGNIVTTTFHILFLKIEYKERICRIQNKRVGIMQI